MQVRGKEYRYSLNKVFGKPPGYEMTKTEAKSLREKLAGQIRDGMVGSMPGQNPDETVTWRIV